MDGVIYVFKSSNFKELLNQTYQQQLKIYQYIIAFDTFRTYEQFLGGRG